MPDICKLLTFLVHFEKIKKMCHEYNLIKHQEANKINVVSFLLKKPELKSYNASFVHLIKEKTGRVVYFRCFFLLNRQ
jgi:hypothetical protein